MLSIFLALLSGLAMAQNMDEPIAAADHFECPTEDLIEEHGCWLAATDHTAGDLCMASHSNIVISGTPLNDVAHVHVVEAVQIAQASSAPWAEQTQERESAPLAVPALERVEERTSVASPVQAEPEAVVSRREPVRVVVRTQPSSRRSRAAGYTGHTTHVRQVRVVAAPVYTGAYEVVHYGGSTNSFEASSSALGDWQAINEDWVAGVRAENQAHENRADRAEELAATAELARKKEEARRIAAQARAVKAEDQRDRGVEVIQGLLAEPSSTNNEGE
jgi:hypothetical protein